MAPQNMSQMTLLTIGTRASSAGLQRVQPPTQLIHNNCWSHHLLPFEEAVYDLKSVHYDGRRESCPQTFTNIVTRYHNLYLHSLVLDSQMYLYWKLLLSCQPQQS